MLVDDLNALLSLDEEEDVDDDDRVEK
jgi:hypothetical protein